MNKELEELLNSVKDTLSGEMLEKAKSCKTVAELKALLGDTGVELSDELMDAVAGGKLIRGDTPVGQAFFGV